MPSTKPSLTVRIDPELKQNLEELAIEEDRSMGSLLTVILKDYFKRKKEVDRIAATLTGDEKALFEQIKSLPLEERQAIVKKLSSND